LKQRKQLLNTRLLGWEWHGKAAKDLPGNKHAKPKGPDPRVQRMTKNVFGRFIKSGP